MRVDQDAMQALSLARCEGNTLTLTGQLDRAVYVKVNKVIEGAGGKWNRKAKAHVFDGDAAEVIDPILLTGKYTRTKQDFGQFDSPPMVVARVIELARIEPGMKVYEPSAGVGNIVAAAKAQGAVVFAHELDEKRHRICQGLFFIGGGIGLGDFLAVEPNPVFDRVAMNPPFQKQADIDHVLHAAKFLRPGGRLVSVMSAGVNFRQDRKATAFRAFLDEHDGEIEVLPEAAFKDASTMVRTVIVHFDI